MKNFKITRNFINQYIANGGDMWLLTDEQRRAISQDIIKQCAANGGCLYDVKEDQVRDITNGGDLSHLTKEQIREIPQDVINQYAANGGDLSYLTTNQIHAIPPNIIKQCAINGGHLFSLTEEQSRVISQDVINQYAANGGSLFSLTEVEVRAIPPEIVRIDENCRNALILYAAGKITKEDLPDGVFANYNLRKGLLRIVKHKTIQQFNELCEKYGYKDHVPDDVIEAFNKRIERIEEEVSRKKIEAINRLQDRELECKTGIVKEIKGLGW